MHHYVSNVGANYTVIDKPIFPVLINNSQIGIGQNWTVTCPLKADHSYHVYCYGKWVNTSAVAKTDYDIYVFDPSGKLESSHTEAAGFPEHLGTTVEDSLFTPKLSGNYSFVLKNDARESEGAQEATFMVIEALECNKWYTHFVEGKADNSTPSFLTCWAFEFVTYEPKVELFVNVPETLDMYEARLYLMSGATSLSINDYPLPLESGLYGNVSAKVGGYNFENEGYRGVAYASCEFMGQAMFLNYSSGGSKAKLYHLVLIGEEGSGEVEFMLKSQFSNATLTPLVFPTRVVTGKPVNLSYVYESDIALERAQMFYTVDGWNGSDVLDMVINGQTCSAKVPGQVAGSLVQFRVVANDVVKNNFTVSGKYSVKDNVALNVTVAEESVFLGENITVCGSLRPKGNDSVVSVQFCSSNNTQVVDCRVAANGTFAASFCPDSLGVWAVSACSVETETFWGSGEKQLLVTVEDPPFHVKYQLYIIVGLVGALAAGGVVYYLRFRH